MYAQVVLDIPIRALDRPFVYLVPPELAEHCVVGATVLVRFSGRAAIGYVVDLSETLSKDLASKRLLSIESVLAESAFDKAHADVALWIAHEYACSPSEALHPFLAPGQGVRIRRSKDGTWELLSATIGPVDERWVALSSEGVCYKPPARAARQRAVLAALAAGPQRMSELSLLITGAAEAVRSLERRGVVVVERVRLMRGRATTSLSSATASRPASYTKGQLAALDAIESARRSAAGDVVLVDGVTGSGKTEVYLAAIERVRSDGKDAIVLVPEIALTAQTVGRFRSRFGDDVAILHSRLSAGERFDQWDLIRRGKAHVVVGARSALYAPVTHLGLIIIDEEHEGSYKQESAPRYHARDVAAHMVRRFGAALVLGSATPSLESLERCACGSWRQARWTRVEMPERPGVAALPRIRVVDMTLQFKGGHRSVISLPLQEALSGVVERHEKAVLLLNRRGFASFLMCRDCGCVPECPHCSTALTYHERGHSLMCHTCGRSWSVNAWPNPMTACPHCGSRYLGAFGVGTQRVEDEVKNLLPEDVDIIRMDADTTRTKGAHQRLLERFDAAPCAVLVGTQMIAKGLDFPEVTLVGVVNADTTLKMPDFRAAERTYCLLEQVAGRAGRGSRAGEVIIQSYWAGHPAIQAVVHHDRELFLVPELVDRRTANYPPYARLANVIAWGTDNSAVERAISLIASAIQSSCIAKHTDWELLGPAECVKAKLKDKHRYHVLIKAPNASELGPMLFAALSGVSIPAGVNVSIDVDAYDLM